MAAAEATASSNDSPKVSIFPQAAKSVQEKVIPSLPNSDEEIQDSVDGAMKDFELESQRTVVDMFRVMPANVAIREAMEAPDPRPLFLNIWYEGQICCLYAKSGNGKSIEAVQAGISVASYKPVIYLDLELSQKQFQRRYSEDGVAYTFPDKFLRADYSPDYHGDKDLIEGIENMCLTLDVDTVIIDNLSWLVANGEKAEDAGRLMRKLMFLKLKYGWSILIVAHTPKKDDKLPISDDDIAGSKVIFNFIDSAFAIGKSIRGEEFRYIKEMKTREDKIHHGVSNVIVTRLDKVNGLTQHVFVCYSDENTELGIENDKPSGLRSLKEMFSFVESPMRYTEIWQHLCQTVKKSNGKFIGERTAKDYIAKAHKAQVLSVNEDDKYYLAGNGEEVQSW